MMEFEHFRETDAPKENQSETAEPSRLSAAGQKRMSMPLSATNPETPEVSRANKEAAPGRDDGLSQAAPTDQTVPPSVSPSAPSDQTALPPVNPSLPTDQTALPSVSPSLPTDQTAAPSASPSAPTDQTVAPSASPSAPTDQTVLPPVSPSLPTDQTAAPSVSPSLPTDKTAAPSVSPSLPTDQTAAPSASPSLPTDQTAAPSVSPSLPTDQTTLPPVSPSLPTDQTAAPPVSPSLPTDQTVPPPVNPSAPTDQTTLPPVSASLPTDQTAAPGDDADVKMPQKFETVEKVNEYYDQAIEKFGDSPTHQIFLNHLQSKGLTLSDLTEGQIDGNFSNYLTRVYGLAAEAGISDTQAGSIVHRMGELHTLKRYPQEIVDGQRLLEQPVFYKDDQNEQRKKELDRVTVRGDTHHIQDIKPIHLDKFMETPAGQQWMTEMSQKHGENFIDQIKTGQLNPFSQLDPETRTALQKFSQQDLKKYEEQLQTYEDLYRQANPNVKKVRAYVQPYYKI